MEFTIKSGDLAEQKTACLILGVFEKRKLSDPAEAIDNADRLWCPETNELYPATGGAEANPAREPDTRYERFLDVYRAVRQADPYAQQRQQQ